ncbi:MAG: cytidylate kinase-like family protein [Dysosmobacter sp.]
MKNRVITISREFGSGGRTIGKQVAAELGIPCYDNELLQKIAQESGFHENYVKEAGEYAPGGFLASAFSHPNSGPNNADYLWKIQYKIISELAERAPALEAGARITFSGTRRTACGFLSTRI